MATSSSQREALRDLSPSAKLVYKVLEHNGELTQQEIAERSRLSPRTVRYALSGLEEIDAIAVRPDLSDPRKKRYQLAECPPTDGAGDQACCAD